MSVRDGSDVTHFQAARYRRDWLRLFVGLLTIGLGAAAFAWPSATVRVIGLLFGLNLVVTGFIRAAQLTFVPGYPPLYRIVGTVLGVITGIVGLFCLGNLTGSVVLLLVIVAIGWLLDGLVEVFLAVGRRNEPGAGWRIGTGLIKILGAVALLVWPKIGLAAFITIGATVLVFVGIGTVISAVAGSSHRQTGGLR
jgi:uncharacterized membrane protein HdeD (DUF308 family)